MTSAAASHPWEVLDYEADMFYAMWSLLRPDHQGYAILDLHIRNAVVESALLHLRQLAAILLSEGDAPDDINLSDLLPGFQPARVDELKRAYGERGQANTPRWIINKMLAHPTSRRGRTYDYTRLLNQLAPLLDHVIQDVRDRRTRGDAV